MAGVGYGVAHWKGLVRLEASMVVAGGSGNVSEMNALVARSWSNVHASQIESGDMPRTSEAIGTDWSHDLNPSTGEVELEPCATATPAISSRPYLNSSFLVQ